MSRLARRIKHEIVEPSLAVEPQPMLGKLLSVSEDGQFGTVRIEYPNGQSSQVRALMLAPLRAGEHGRPPTNCQVMLIWPGRHHGLSPWVVGLVYPQVPVPGTILWPRRPIG